MNANLRPESPNAQRIVWNALDAQAQAQTLERPAQTADLLRSLFQRWESSPDAEKEPA